MTSSLRTIIASCALIAGLLSCAATSAAQPGTGAQDPKAQDPKAQAPQKNQDMQKTQDPKVARILRTFASGRRVLIQTSASEPVMKSFDQAEQKFTAGDTDGALVALEDGLKREARKTTFRVIWAAYSRIAEDYDRLDRCVSFMQDLVNSYPNVPDVRAALAGAYGVKAAKLPKTDPTILKEVIRISNLSREQLDVALLLDPESFMARLARAITLSYPPSVLAEAEEDFDKLLAMQALRKNPWYPYHTVYYFYADALKRGDKLTRAAEVLKLGLHHYPNNADLKRLLDEVTRLGAGG